jgi:hypothetical protein
MHIRACTLVLILCCAPCVLASAQQTAASTLQPDDSSSRTTDPTSAHAARFGIAKETASAKPQDGAAPAAPAPAAPAPKTNDSGSKDVCSDPQNQPIDCRDNFEANAYVGIAVDTFAAGELNKYFNPDDANKIKVRGVGGFDFAYRLYNGPCSDNDKRNNQGSRDCDSTSPGKPQLWVFGETVHGARSADVDCKANPNLSVCKLFLSNPTFSPDQTLYLLRNATSLEAYAGARAEFFTVAPNSKSPANLYLRTEAGFLTVAGAGKLTPNHTSIALGLIATSGRFHESFLDVGYGRTKLFAVNPNHRWKVHGYLTWNAFGEALGRYVRPYAEMTVDTDLGPGADSVQSYFGINFDVDCVFNPGRCSKSQ